jgi:hypothetical protein
MFASAAMSAEPIATALAVPITATWVDVKTLNCDAVSATNCAVVNALSWSLVSALV